MNGPLSVEELAMKTFNITIGVLTAFGILFTLFSIVGIFGVLAYIRHHVKKAVNKVRNEFSYKTDIEQAVDIYETQVERAILLTERAVKSGSLSGISLAVAKSNLGYYYAFQGERINRDKALRFAREAMDEAYLYPLMTCTLLINYGYVWVRYAENDTELSHARNFLRGLLRRDDLRRNEREEIENYLTINPI